MSHSLQPLRHLNFDLSPYPFKALARRHFRFLAWCTALTLALWVPLNPIAAQTRALTAITLATTVADFNGDGIPDLAIVSTNTYAGGSYTLAVFLGKGDGTFRAGPTIQPSGMQVDPFMIFGDFNGDGKLDLAMLTWGLDSTSYLTILLNNGDSSFTAKPTVVAVSQSN